MTANDQIAEMKRIEYLRGISITAPERTVLRDKARHDILRAAFDQVENKADWKGPINALVEVHAMDTIGVGVYLDAIEYFTGCKAQMFLHSDSPDRTASTFRIVAEGYRLAQG
jgi:hypothetical protein